MFTWFFRLLTSISDLNGTPRVVERLATPHTSLLNNCPSANTGDTEISGKSSVLPKLHTRPLRTIQWVEAGGKSAFPARRMVISGRFADVCAEIDRLAALEGA